MPKGVDGSLGCAPSVPARPAWPPRGRANTSRARLCRVLRATTSAARTSVRQEGWERGREMALAEAMGDSLRMPALASRGRGVARGSAGRTLVSLRNRLCRLGRFCVAYCLGLGRAGLEANLPGLRSAVVQSARGATLATADVGATGVWRCHPHNRLSWEVPRGPPRAWK